MATRLDPDLPDGWPIRVLAGLEALSELHHGSLLVRADLVEVKGVSGSQQARARITQILSGKLGQARPSASTWPMMRNWTRWPPCPPRRNAPPRSPPWWQRARSPSRGVGRDRVRSLPVIAALAEVLEDCPGLKMEIGGHTDAQGSEGGNKALSQARAEAVLVALQGRRVDVSGMTAVGYGEGIPIADNGTEEGREANRRIEFVLKEAPPAAAAADGLVEALPAGPRRILPMIPRLQWRPPKRPCAPSRARIRMAKAKDNTP